MNVYTLSSIAGILLLTAACSTTEKVNPDEPKVAEITITDFSPTSAGVGDTITINGTNFGTTAADVTVALGSADTTPYKVTPTQMKVIVPVHASSGKIQLNIKTAFALSDARFEFMPVADYFSFSPLKARPGELIKISSDYNDADPASVRVQFAGTTEWMEPVEVLSVRNILVRVPPKATTGKITIRSAKQKPGLSQTEFTVLPAMPEVAQGVWTERASNKGSGNEGASKSGTFVFTANNKAYIGGGTSLAPLDGFGSKELWEYDPQYNTWMQKANLGAEARVYAAAFSIDNKGYVGTGLDANADPVKDFWEYNPSTNTWTKKADFPGDSRGFAVGFAIGNDGYIGTGQTATTALADMYRYSPATNAWTAVAPIPLSRSHAYAFSASNKAYIGGGTDAAQKVTIRDLYEYDPASDKWTAKTGIPGYNYSCLNAATSLNGKGYVGLGHLLTKVPVSYQGSKEVYEYTPATDAWKVLPIFGGSNRSAGIAFASDKAIYFGLGQASARTNAYSDIWGYKP
jgi:N-acetylneuraminic acid mutarotase